MPCFRERERSHASLLHWMPLSLTKSKPKPLCDSLSLLLIKQPPSHHTLSVNPLPCHINLCPTRDSVSERDRSDDRLGWSPDRPPVPIYVHFLWASLFRLLEFILSVGFCWVISESQLCSRVRGELTWSPHLLSSSSFLFSCLLLG